ncbi:MAG: adenylate/guanylate cyclase domain-containing protein [Planctomycetes bacterium]|nr:adenylate/guanylate cyclase domain-containing protein [Planctomycetota bacterium]
MTEPGVGAIPAAALEQAFAGSLPGWTLRPVLAWLAGEGRRAADLSQLLAGLGERLAAAGAPVWRLRVSLRTLHPQVAAFSSVWLRGRGASAARVLREVTVSDAFIGSPIAHVIGNGTPFRRDLRDLVEGSDHQALHDVRAEGGTDYLALPAQWRDGIGAVFIVVSDAQGGFDATDLVKLTALVECASPVLEVLALRHVARSLLDTYLGPRTGERVLRGQVRRGDGETIEAALWFSDLRDFTPLTESLPPERLLDTLNVYFELVAAAVTARGGEILRFIGDAMLIVFPTTPGDDGRAACHAAMDAAEDAFAALAAQNHRRRRAGEPQLRFGVGLHFGTVVYGNVGAPDRLDFTVMGTAVNRTARLESLTKTLGRPVLVSAEFGQRIDRPLEDLGLHPMKGVATPQPVFAPADAGTD